MNFLYLEIGEIYLLFAFAKNTNQAEKGCAVLLTVDFNPEFHSDSLEGREEQRMRKKKKGE